MSKSILTTTPKNTTPHTKLNDEQLNPHNNKNTTPHRKLNDEQLNPHNNNKKHNTTQTAKR